MVAVVLHMHLVVAGGSGKHYQCCRWGILEVLTFAVVAEIGLLMGD